MRQTKHLLAILAMMDGQSFEQKALGLIDHFTGRLFYRGLEGRLNSDCYAACLRRVLGQTEERIALAQDGARYHTGAARRGFFEQRADRLTAFTVAELLAGLQSG